MEIECERVIWDEPLWPKQIIAARMGLAAFSSMTLKDESSPRQIDKPWKTLQMQKWCMSIQYGQKAVKLKALLSKPTFKLSKLATCENMIRQETLRGLMSGEGEVLFIFAWAGKAQPGL